VKKCDILTTSVMLRIFLFIVSLSWLAVGVNHSFWNVSFTSFCREEKIVQDKPMTTNIRTVVFMKNKAENMTAP